MVICSFFGFGMCADGARTKTACQSKMHAKCIDSASGARYTEDMTQRILKYTLTTTSDNTIEMPIGAKILSVQAQKGEICIWALEEDARATDLVSRRFRVFGTGHTIAGGNALTYLGTVQLLEGRLVLHVFEDAR